MLYHTAKFDHAKLNVRQLRVPAAQIEQLLGRFQRIPARAGEVLRAYMLRRKEGVPVSARRVR